MSNISTLPIPSCEPSLFSVGISKWIPFFDVTTDTELSSELVNGVVKMNHQSSVYVKEYASKRDYTVNKQFTKEITDSYGFKCYLPEKLISFPGLSISNFPRLHPGCNDKIDSDWPLICGPPSLRRVQHCRRFFGKNICISSYVPEFDKRLGEISLEDLQVPPKTLLDFQETELNFKFKLIPKVTTRTAISAGESFGVSFGLGAPSIDTGTPVLSFVLSKLVVGLTINLDVLKFTYGGKGLDLENISIPILIDQDLLTGGSVTATVTNTEVSAYYFIKQIKLSLLQLMVVPLIAKNAIGLINDPTFQSNASSVGKKTSNAANTVGNASIGVGPNRPNFANLGSNFANLSANVEDDLAAQLPQVGNAWGKYCAPIYDALKRTIGSARAKMIFNKIVNFLRETSIDIAIGLLLCPQMLPGQANILSCVFTSAVSLQPFAALNKVEKVNIPDDYIPKIPSLDINFFGQDIVNTVINTVNGVVANAERGLSTGVSASTEFIDKTLAGLSLDLVANLPVPIIPNPNVA